MSELLTLDEIADALKLRREYVRDRLVKRADFPRPCMQLSQKNRRWSAADLDSWRSRQEAQNAR